MKGWAYRDKRTGGILPSTIRAYQLVKDHVTDIENKDTNAVLNGAIDCFLPK